MEQRGADMKRIRRFAAKAPAGRNLSGPQPLAGEAVFTKRRYDAFAGTGLDAHLRALKRDTLVIAGLTTECCVDSTARDARSSATIMSSSLRMPWRPIEPDLHHAALKALELNCATARASRGNRRGLENIVGNQQ